MGDKKWKSYRNEINKLASELFQPVNKIISDLKYQICAAKTANLKLFVHHFLGNSSSSLLNNLLLNTYRALNVDDASDMLVVIVQFSVSNDLLVGSREDVYGAGVFEVRSNAFTIEFQSQRVS